MVTEKVIVLRKTKFGESDLIVSCLTSHGQVVNLMAKAALKSRKRFGGGVLEPTHYITATYRLKSGRSSGEEALGFLTEATLNYDFPQIRADYEKLNLALHIVKVISMATREGDVAMKGLFDLAGNALKALETSTNPAALKTHFEVKFLNLQGVLPVSENIREVLHQNIARHADLPAGEWSSIRKQLQPVLESYLSL